MCAMKYKLMCFAVASVAGGCGLLAGVVPVERPGLVLPGRTLSDVRTNAVSGRTVGAHFFPGELTGLRKTVVAGTAMRPEKMHVEMQNLDSGFLKALVLELTERADGVWGQVIAARYLPSAGHDLGFAFERPDGSFAGSPMDAVTTEKGRGYGVRDLALLPVEVRGPGVDVSVTVADHAAAIAAGRGVIARFAGREVADALKLEIIPAAAGGRPSFEIADGGRTLRASDAATLAKAFYTDVTRKCAGQFGWKRKVFDRTAWERPAPDLRVVSPYRRHAYMQVCAMGYTTPFWGEDRWLDEIDWMALHGFDLPLAYPAYEAIFARVMAKYGLTEKEIGDSFSGPAHLPWSRMGNTSGGPDRTPSAWLARSVRVQHAILKRVRELGMDCVLQGFAGIVPEALHRVRPQAKITRTGWSWGGGGHRAWFLHPDDPLFAEICTDFIREWEKEFGTCTYYLADSFNEMKLPWKGEPAVTDGLKACGRNIYGAMKAANPHAVWTLMGWIFVNDRKVWTPAHTAALFGEVPDDKMLLLDMAVDAFARTTSRHTWNWNRYSGFYGKRWVWSTIPNFGGLTLLTGDLSFYANGHLPALASPDRGNLFAYGTMPEGIEQNDVIYELVSCAGWSDRPIDVDAWLANYSRNRWGIDGAKTAAYWKAMRQGLYGEWNIDVPGKHDHFNWMTHPTKVRAQPHGLVHHLAALREMRALAHEGNALFRDDFAVQAAHEAGHVAELLLATGAPADADEAFRLLEGADAVLAGHPTHDLREWIRSARACAEGNAELADAYETNARRIITTWGPGLDNYAARLWCGTVKDYYLAQLRLVRTARESGRKADLAAFRRAWIDGRQPLAPPVAGWTNEKLSEETLRLGSRFVRQVCKEEAVVDEPMQADAHGPADYPALSDFNPSWPSASPGLSVSKNLPTAALLGNGSLGAVNGGDAKGKSFMLTRGDLWGCGDMTRAKPISFGCLDILCGEKSVGSTGTLDIASVTLRTEGAFGRGKVKLESFVAAEEDIFVVTGVSSADDEWTVRFTANGQSPQAFSEAHGAKDGFWVHRSTTNLAPKDPRSWTTNATAAVSAVGAALSPGVVLNSRSAEAKLKIAANRPFSIVVATDPSRHFDAAALERIRTAHAAWWREWWNRSRIALGDRELERFYYGQLYLLGSCVRQGKFPAGLYGIWPTTDDPSASNDFHLNYNYMATYYGCFSANRCEVAETMPDPLIAYLPRAAENAKRRLGTLTVNWNGRKMANTAAYLARRTDLANGIDDAALYPVGLGPWGLSSFGDTCHCGQVSDGVFQCALMCTHWEYTLDRAYLKKVWPLFDKTANFFLKWCEKEPLPNGGYRYVVYDSHWEGSGMAKNSVVALGSIRRLFTTLADVTPVLREIGIDVPAAKADAWRDFAAHLSELPTGTASVGGVPRRVLSGVERSDGKAELALCANAVNLESVIPCEAFAFDVTDEFRALATNTVNAMLSAAGDRIWLKGNNQTPKLYAMAIRMGYPCRPIIEAFRKHEIRGRGQLNFHLRDNEHGVEKIGAMEFVNSMLIQSDGGFVKVFPNWTGADAKFENLRAKGAFIVSAEMKGGAVTRVEVTAEKGGTFRLVDPFGGRVTPQGAVRGKTRHSGEPTLEISMSSGERICMDRSAIRTSCKTTKTPKGIKP